jgi:hypothetical protein
MTKLESYLESLENCFKNGITPQAFIDAALATGDVSDCMTVILSIARFHGIAETDLTAIAENNAKWQVHKSKQTGKETASYLGNKFTELAEKSPAMEAGEFKKALADLLAEATALAAPADASETSFITAKELMSKTYPARNWIVENLIGPGLTILSGAPKIGKSWLMLSLAEAVSTGGNFLSEFKATESGVLHLALEETERSIYERRKNLKFFHGKENLIIATRYDGQHLESFLRARPDIRLVIIDTLGRFMPEIEDMNDYAGTVKPLSALKRIADELDIAILAVHHAKKGSQSGKEKGDWMDSSLGSQGIAGSADATLVLQRDIDKDSGERQATGRLYGTGRNMRDIFRKLKFDADIGSWAVDDKTPEPQADTEDKKPIRKVFTREDIKGML